MLSVTSILSRPITIVRLSVIIKASPDLTQSFPAKVFSETG